MGQKFVSEFNLNLNLFVTDYYIYVYMYLFLFNFFGGVGCDPYIFCLIFSSLVIIELHTKIYLHRLPGVT